MRSPTRRWKFRDWFGGAIAAPWLTCGGDQHGRDVADELSIRASIREGEPNPGSGFDDTGTELQKRSGRVANSAVANAYTLGIASRMVRRSQYAAVCRIRRIWLARGQLVRSEAS
jgi:hypothetical protein